MLDSHDKSEVYRNFADKSFGFSIKCIWDKGTDLSNILKQETKISLNKRPKVNSIRPSVDIMMSSAAKMHGKNVIGVLLTGMGADGARGMKDIKDNGGKTIAQDKNSCVVFGMPKEAIALDAVDRIVPLSKIASEILDCLNGGK